VLPQQQVARYVVLEYQQKYLPVIIAAISCVHQSRLTGLTTTRPSYGNADEINTFAGQTVEYGIEATYTSTTPYAIMKKSCVTAAGTDIGSNNSPSFNGVSSVAMACRDEIPHRDERHSCQSAYKDEATALSVDEPSYEGSRQDGRDAEQRCCQIYGTASPPREEIKRGTWAAAHESKRK